MAVSAGAIVEPLDVIVDLGIGDITRLVDSLLDPLLLQAAKKRFGHCVTPAVSTPECRKGDRLLFKGLRCRYAVLKVAGFSVST